MSYLLDTNVLSELRRKVPDPNVVRWFSQRPAGTLYLSVLTLGEIRKGIETMVDEPRRLPLLDWLETELPAFFSGRVLPIDARVADRWGRLVALAGRPVARHRQPSGRHGVRSTASFLSHETSGTCKGWGSRRSTLGRGVVELCS